MHHYFENTIKLLTIVYILCNQIIGLNSKSSILWKLNDKSGKIVSYSDSHQHVSVRTDDTYLNIKLTLTLWWCICSYMFYCIRNKSHIIAYQIFVSLKLYWFYRFQLAKEILEIYENDAIFSIIASASGIRTTDNWEIDVDSTCTADYLYTSRAYKYAFCGFSLLWYNVIIRDFIIHPSHLIFEKKLFIVLINRYTMQAKSDPYPKLT